MGTSSSIKRDSQTDPPLASANDSLLLMIPPPDWLGLSRQGAEATTLSDELPTPPSTLTPNEISPDRPGSEFLCCVLGRKRSRLLPTKVLALRFTDTVTGE